MPLPEVVGLEKITKPFAPPPYTEALSDSLDESIIQDAPPERGKQATLSGAIEDTVRPDEDELTRLQAEENLRQQGFGLPIGDLQGPFAYDVAEGLQGWMNKFQGRSKITAAEANRLYPDMPTPFTGDTYIEFAHSRWERVQKRRKLLDWMSRGPELGLGRQLLAGLPTIVEPVNALVTYLSGGFLGKYVPKAGLGIEIGVNVAENLALDLPSRASLIAQQQEVQSLGETITGSVAGGVGGTLFFKALGKAVGAGVELSKRKFGSPEALDRAVKEALTQAESGKKINTSYADELSRAQHSSRTAGLLDPQYRFSNFETTPDRVFYSGISGIDSRGVEGDISFGKGVFAIDDPYLMRNLTGSAESELSGTIRELSIPTPDKLLDIDKPLDDPKAAGVKSFFDEKFGKDLPEDIKTVKQALEYLDDQIKLDAVPESVRDSLTDSLKKQGVDGYRFIEAREDGTRDNRAFIFDEENAKIVNESEVIKEELPRVPDDMADKSRSYIEEDGNYKYDDPDILADVEQKGLMDNEAAYKSNDLEQINKTSTAAMEKLQTIAETDPHLKQELKEMNKEFSDDAKVRKISDELIKCDGVV